MVAFTILMIAFLALMITFLTLRIAFFTMMTFCISTPITDSVIVCIGEKTAVLSRIMSLSAMFAGMITFCKGDGNRSGK